MPANELTLRRRPFFAPIWVLALLGSAALGGLWLLYQSLHTTTFIVIRHAEKELGTIDDPPLSEEGERRAQRLAQMFGERRFAGRIQAVFTSDTHRAQMTAAPLATRLALTAQVIPVATNTRQLIQRARERNRGSIVLIVGHSDTVPEIVTQLSGIAVPPLHEDEFDAVFVVSVPSIGAASVTRFKY
jgi:broad specificity phosphatase PhoE